jgi:hypothetical protein
VTLAPVGETRTMTVTAIQKGISLPALQRFLGHDHLTTVVREFKEKW